MLKMAKQGVFWTVQGEGFYCGEPMIFVRLAGCSVGCAECDTNYRPFSEAPESDIVNQCVSLRKKHGRADYVWITGGEPTDQNLSTIVALLWDSGFKPCLATAGTRKLSGQWWWVSVSPHSNDFELKTGSEIKLVPGLNGLRLADMDLSKCSFHYRYVQPLVGSRESMQECLRWLEGRPEWRLSPQCHKSWGLS